MTRTASRRPGRTLAVLLAGGRGSHLHELTASEAKAALPFAGHRRVVDWAMMNATDAGIDRMLVATQHRSDSLHRHLQARWGTEVSLALRDGRAFAKHGAGHGLGYRGTADALSRNIAEIDEAAPREVLILSGDHVYELDLGALVAAHRRSGACATLSTVHAPDHAAEDEDEPGRSVASQGIMAFDWPWLRAALLADLADPRSSHDLERDILPLALAEGGLLAWRAPGRPYWRDLRGLDAFRGTALDFARGRVPCCLPEEKGQPLGEPAAPTLVIEAGGLSLSAPRFGARQRGRWTLLEDTVVMAGARVAPGARLSRAIVAPGAVVPSGLVVGEDPAEDARWFRVTPGGTTLVTAPMLARRAAERMRAHVQARPRPDLHPSELL